MLEYFEPAAQLGLTATPKRKHNADTYAISASRFTPTRCATGSRRLSDAVQGAADGSTIDEYVYDPRMTS
jgi:type I restriction enzyme R subunit